MAEVTSDDLAFGSGIMGSLQVRTDGWVYGHVDIGFPIRDVIEAILDFDSDVSLNKLDLRGVPCILHGSDLPVSIALSELVFNQVHSAARGDRGDQDLRRLIQQRLELFEGRFVERQEARSSFDRLAASFIANRRAGVRELTERTDVRMLQLAPTVRTPGCTFEVYTTSPGLRVHWSGAYRISGNYFGSPTSPTRSVLQSGVYVFGVDGGAYTTTQWDTSTKVTLRDRTALSP